MSRTGRPERGVGVIMFVMIIMLIITGVGLSLTLLDRHAQLFLLNARNRMNLQNLSLQVEMVLFDPVDCAAALKGLEVGPSIQQIYLPEVGGTGKASTDVLIGASGIYGQIQVEEIRIALDFDPTGKPIPFAYSLVLSGKDISESLGSHRLGARVPIWAATVDKSGVTVIDACSKRSPSALPAPPVTPDQICETVTGGERPVYDVDSRVCITAIQAKLKGPSQH